MFFFFVKYSTSFKIGGFYLNFFFACSVYYKKKCVCAYVEQPCICHRDALLCTARNERPKRNERILKSVTPPPPLQSLPRIFTAFASQMIVYTATSCSSCKHQTVSTTENSFIVAMRWCVSFLFFSLVFFSLCCCCCRCLYVLFVFFTCAWRLLM